MVLGPVKVLDWSKKGEGKPISTKKQILLISLRSKNTFIFRSRVGGVSGFTSTKPPSFEFPEVGPRDVCLFCEQVLPPI